MTEKEYPPVFLKPGDTTRITASDGYIDFIGVHGDPVLDFIEAYAELRMLKNAGMQPSDATKQYAERKVEKAWQALPNGLFMEIDRRAADAHT